MHETELLWQSSMRN